MKIKMHLIPTTLPALIFILGACAQSVGLAPIPTGSTSSSQASQPSFAQFQDIPTPPGARMNLDRTVILGAPASWIGRLALTANQNPSVVFDFYKQRIPEFGWREVTTVRAATSFMTFTRSNRVLNIQIKSQTIQGSEVDLTISPKGVPGATAPSETQSSPPGQ